MIFVVHLGYSYSVKIKSEEAYYAIKSDVSNSFYDNYQENWKNLENFNDNNNTLFFNDDRNISERNLESKRKINFYNAGQLGHSLNESSEGQHDKDHNHNHDHSNISRYLSTTNFNSLENYSTTETFDSGTLIIPMDNSLQASGGDFNLKVYGLIVHLLHADIPLKWSIASNKSKNGKDFSAISKIVNSTNTPTNRDFRSGPIIITPGYESQALTVINNFGNSVNIYELKENNKPIEIAENLAHKPKGAIFNNGGNAKIHRKAYQEAGLIEGTHFEEVSSAASINGSSCYTFASEPHTKPGDISTTIVNNVRTFVQNGGNFLAQCEGVEAYANSSNGSLLVTFASKPDIGGNIIYGNNSEPFAQTHGDLKDQGGSVESFKFASNPGSRIAYDNNDGANYKAYVGRIAGSLTSKGGYVHYLAGHEYKEKDGEESINGLRMFLNAYIRPADRPANCGLTICENVTNPGRTTNNNNFKCITNGAQFLTIPNIILGGASGGNGGTIEYQWQIKYDGGSWTDITEPGATNENYTPPNGRYNATTNPFGWKVGQNYWRRRARRDCQSSWINSGYEYYHITENIDNPGSISGDESKCGSYNPGNIASATTPSGGGPGNRQYQWESKVGSGVWTVIPGATSGNYNPPTTIPQTTKYRRGVRIESPEDCAPYLYSNVITKTIENTSINLTCQYKIGNNNSWVMGDCDVNLSVGQKLRLSVDPNNIGSYVWTGPNNFSKNGNNNGNVLVSGSVTTAMSGTYEVTVTNNEGCVSTKQINVTVCETASNETTATTITEQETKILVGNPTGGTWSIVSGGGSITGTTYTPADINTDTTIVIRYTIAADGDCAATSA
ncbi:MAG: hypothetical protein P8P88_11880, partial [Polaribacter sp.]|nr:hypothetical protein [Polaribacter sp.]